MQIVFNIIATVIFLIFGVTWSKKGLLNIMLKIICIGMSMSGVILVLGQLGYIIKK